MMVPEMETIALLVEWTGIEMNNEWDKPALWQWRNLAYFMNPILKAPWIRST